MTGVSPRFVELTDESWPLFGPGGVRGGCCAFFRLSGPEYRRTDAAGHRTHVRAEVRARQPLGLLALVDEEPMGWVAVSPRIDNPKLANSTMAALPGGELDTSGIWSVTCFYVHRRARRRGLSAALLEAAATYATECGARVVEGYPVDVNEQRPGSDLYHGTVRTFVGAGCTLVERRGPNRALMRRRIR